MSTEVESNALNKKEPDALETTAAKQAAWWFLEDEKAALAYCRSMILFYQGIAEKNLIWWTRLQWIAIVSGALATFLIAAGAGDFHWLGGRSIVIAGSFFAATATVASSLMAAFSYRLDSIRQGTTADALQGELAKYLSHSNPYQSKNKVGIFMANIRHIISIELEQRRSNAPPDAKITTEEKPLNHDPLRLPGRPVTPPSPPE